MICNLISAVLSAAIWWHTAGTVVTRAWLDWQELVRVLEVVARRVVG